MPEKVFLQILNMSFTASFVIVFVLIARLLLKKAPKALSYALWTVVLFRLICPFSFESMFSLLPAKSNPLSQNIMYEAVPRIDTGIPVINDAINASLPAATPYASVNPLQVWVFIGTVVWLLGIAVVLMYSIFSLLKLQMRLKNAVHDRDNIYLAEQLETPFVMGIIQPKIYLPTSLTAEEKRYILLHEQMHIRRFDHVVKLVSFFVLCLHWFNPLVWAAFFVSGRDMEMSCDEAVIKQLGSDVKKEYSTSLLTLATGRRMIGGTPLAFGEGDTKGRIKNVLSYKKPAFWVLILSLIAVLAICLGLALNPAEKTATVAVTFPQYALESSSALHDVKPFTVRLDLPSGWDIRQAEADSEATGYFGEHFLYELQIYDGDAFIGQMGFQVFEPYEDEIPQAEYYKTVYPQLRLGRFYVWEPYTPVKTAQDFEAAVVTVSYMEPDEIEAHAGALASAPVTEVPGILAYDKARGVYVGIQFAENAVPLGQAEKIARSLSFADASTSSEDAEKLWAYRTKYVGDNSAVGNIIGALAFPDGVHRQGFELHTNEKPFALTVKLQTDTQTRNFYTGALNEAPFQINACILFSLIENVQYINFDLDDGVLEPYSMQYTADWADNITGTDVWESSKTLPEFETLLTTITSRVNGAIEAAQGRSPAQPGGLPFFVKPDEPVQVIGETAAILWLKTYMEESTPDSSRIESYKINEVTVISGTPKAGKNREDMNYHYVVRMNYDITTASDEYFAPGDGVAGKGNFEGLFRELCVKDLGGGNFDIISAGTGGGEQEFADSLQRFYFENLSEEDEKLYQIMTQQRLLQEWQIHSLTSTGFTFQEIIHLPDMEIAKILAPGSAFMGDIMTEEEFYKLLDSGMPEENIYILQNLGYDYASVLALTPEQINFILPNTELVGKLVALGYDRSMVEAAGFLHAGGWETYKELLDEVFEKYPNGKPKQ